MVANFLVYISVRAVRIKILNGESKISSAIVWNNRSDPYAGQLFLFENILKINQCPVEFSNVSYDCMFYLNSDVPPTFPHFLNQ